VRQQFQDSHMPVDEAPDDDQVRQSYNFAPGYHGLVYRADGSDHGGPREEQNQTEGNLDTDSEPRYKLQSMQWGMYHIPPRSTHAHTAQT
jgi:hypothetical protein